MERQPYNLGILGKLGVTFVSPGQKQPSGKLFDCCVTPLPVPAPGDIHISTQGSCTSSGYSAMMEKCKILLRMPDAHKPDLDANLSWLYAVMQVFMPLCFQGALACKKQLVPGRNRRLYSGTFSAASFPWKVLPVSIRYKETIHNGNYSLFLIASNVHVFISAVFGRVRFKSLLSLYFSKYLLLSVCGKELLLKGRL